MRTLQHFLESAPKSALTAIHKRLLDQQGLLSSSRILQELLDFLRNPERFHAYDQKRSPWQQDCLRWVYRSRARGFTHSELVAALPRENQPELANFLLDACENLILFRIGHQGTYTYFGFFDYCQAIPSTPPTAIPDPGSRWYGHGVQLFWHLVRTCALVQQSDLRITSTGELHRRSLTKVEEAFVSTKIISESAPSDERILLLEFLSEQGWFLQNDGEIRLSEVALESLSQHPGRLRHHFFQWWLIKRTGMSAHDFRKWFQQWPEHLELGAFAEMLWPLTPHGKPPNPNSATHAWAGLPRVLRELWLLGIVDLNLEKGRHSRIRLSRDAIHWRLESSWESEILPVHAPVGTPNFEAVLPATSHTKFLFIAACISEILGEDGFLRIQFSKERMLTALRTGLSPIWIAEFFAWAKLPQGVMSAMEEWRGIHCGASIRLHTTLRILDSGKWKELSEFPQFLLHVEESIPLWGFILKPGHDRPVRDLLSHFGLEPPQDLEAKRGIPLTHGSWSIEFGVMPTVQGPIDFEWQPAEVRSAVANALSVQSKYNTDFQLFDPAQTLKVLRYAMVMEVPVEAVLIDPTFPKVIPSPQIIQILRINNRREPYRISATRQDGAPFDFTMDQIQKLRLTSV